MYYARIAERYYLKMVGEAEAAPAKYVLLDPQDESCLIVPGYTQMKATDLLFKVKKAEGECVSEFVRDGLPMEDSLGLCNLYKMKEMKGVETREPAEEGMGFYTSYELPEDIKKNVCGYVFKLVNLEDLVDEMLWGWGDDEHCNLFEFMKRGIDMVEEDAKTGVFCGSPVLYLSKAGFDYPYAMLSFSHFEVQEDTIAPFVYVCYQLDLIDDDDE